MTNASDDFFSSGQGLLYPLGSETQWVGRWRGGEIVSEPRSEQELDINTKDPLFWDANRTQPKMQLVFDVMCNGSGPAAQMRVPTDERVDAQDDGRRTVYVKGKDKKDAIMAQLKKHSRPGLRVGDHYYECWTGNRDGKLGKARTWDAMLFPGAGQAQTQFFGNEQQPAAPSAPSTVPPVGQPMHIPAWSGAPAGPAANPGPPPQFGQPAAAHTGTVPNGFGQAAPQPEAQRAAPPANPWGQAPPVQNPYAEPPF